jgi:hypothetical protein
MFGDLFQRLRTALSNETPVKTETEQRETFAAQMADALKLAGETRTIRFEPLEYVLWLEGAGEPEAIALEKLFPEYQGSGLIERPLVLQKLARSLRPAAIPAAYADAAPRLLPTVRSRVEVAASDMLARAEGRQPPRRPLAPIGEDMVSGLAYELPDTILEVTEEHVGRWRIPEAEVRAKAIENLRQRGAGISREIARGYHAFSTGDHWDASRLLLVDAIRGLPLSGRPVALVLGRDQLQVAGTDNPIALAELAEAAEKALEEDASRVISGRPLVLDGESWTPYVPEPSHTLSGRFRALRLQALAKEYERQKASLERFLERRGEKVEVVALSVTHTAATGEVYSSCTWTLGEPALLPRADRVFLVDCARPASDNVVCVASWQDLAALPGTLLAATADVPERFRVSAGPSADQMSAMDMRPRLTPGGA